MIDPRLASYGSSDYIQAITQLAQTALRSVVGKMELDHLLALASHRAELEKRPYDNRATFAAIACRA